MLYVDLDAPFFEVIERVEFIFVRHFACLASRSPRFQICVHSQPEETTKEAKCMPARSGSGYSIVSNDEMPQQQPWNSSGRPGPSGAYSEARDSRQPGEDKSSSWLPQGLLPEVRQIDAAPAQVSSMNVKARRKALIASYSVDWIVSIALVITFSFIDRIDGYHRKIDLLDTGIQYPFATSERVPVWLLFVIAVAFPVLVILAVGGIRRSTLDVHNGLLGLLLAVSCVTCCCQRH